MAARDHYAFEMRCPTCGRSGTIRFSEPDHPYMTADQTTVDGHPDWVTKKYGRQGEEPWCTKDGVKLVSMKGG